MKGNLAGTEEQGWAGVRDMTSGIHRLRWQPGLPHAWPLCRGWAERLVSLPRMGWGRPPSLPDYDSPGEFGGEEGARGLWVRSLHSHSCFNQCPPFLLLHQVFLCDCAKKQVCC